MTTVIILKLLWKLKIRCLAFSSIYNIFHFVIFVYIFVQFYFFFKKNNKKNSGSAEIQHNLAGICQQMKREVALADIVAVGAWLHCNVRDECATGHPMVLRSG